MCKYLLYIALFLGSCSNEPVRNTLDIQGHRGCRGLMPENTLSAFIKAVDIGVNTLELDVVITKDKKVLISHEPYMSFEICQKGPDYPTTESNEMDHNIYHMEYAEVAAYDCGSLKNEEFPNQEKLKSEKPLFEDLIQAIEFMDSDISYNVEIKRRAEWDNLYHPHLKEYADLVIQVIFENNIQNKTTIQSFDRETLQYVKSQNLDLKLGLLTDSQIHPTQHLSKLGFMPEVYSPYFKFVDQATVTYCHQNGMKIIPWTVNESDDILSLLKMNVDGVISDYPNRIIALLQCLYH